VSSSLRDLMSSSLVRFRVTGANLMAAMGMSHFGQVPIRKFFFCFFCLRRKSSLSAAVSLHTRARLQVSARPPCYKGFSGREFSKQTGPAKKAKHLFLIFLSTAYAHRY
jgi:hypothetical protein